MSQTSAEEFVMANRVGRVFLWAPRLLGIGTALFVALFALDAVGQGAVVLLIHLMPALLLLAVVALAWHREWVGAAGFLSLATLYAVSAWPWVSWMLLLSAPGFIVGSLYLWSRHLHDAGLDRPRT